MRRLPALLLLATVLTVVPAPRSDAAPPGFGGDQPEVMLVGQVPLPRLGLRQVHLSITRFGYRFIGGSADQRLTITEVGGRLRFVDRAARSWKKMPRTCQRLRVPGAAAASCAIPQQFRARRMYLEIWPQLGNDVVDGHTLPARYRMWVLGDAGRETIRMGAGSDFANGAMQGDVIDGGAGNDWIRSGKGANEVYGGPGDDHLAGGDDAERLHGGPGRDRVFGGTGDDVLWGDDGADVLNGEAGRDTAVRDPADRVSKCEVLRSPPSR